MIQDARYALRSLWRAPGFTFVALITLALGIGGTTAIFSVVDGILLRPLPYPHPEAIVRVSRGESGASSFSAADFLDYQQSSRSFQSMAGYRPDVVDLTGRGDPVRLVSFETTAAFFDVIGLPPLAGRTYTETVDTPSGPRVAVLSEGVWATHFGRAPDVVGSTIRLNRIAYTVLGIMPAALMHPDNPDLWVLAPKVVPTSPVPIEGDATANREVNYFQAIARLKPDVTLAQADAELGTIAARLAREYPDTNDGETANVTPLQESLVGNVRDALLVLLGAVGFVLLIACANVASLLLVRGTGRRRELSVRSALGASRGRLLGQLLTESLVLAIAGGVLGLLVAYWGIALLLAVAPDSIPRIDEVSLDPRVAVFGILVSALVGVLFGLAPAFQAARANMVDALKDGGRSGTSRTGLRSGLVVAEIALSLMLLIGAGLMLTSFARLRGVDPGFVVNSLVVVAVPLPQARYDNTAQARFYEQLHERVTANSVTSRAALIFPQPFGGANAQAGYQIEGAPRRARSERTVAELNSVSPGYFQTMGIALLRGRDLSFADKRDGQSVIVINRTLAEREWPGQDPIGQRLAIGSSDDPNAWITVVGVVADSKRSDLQAEAEPAIYLALPQFVLPYMSVVVRTDAGEAAVASAVKAAVSGVDPELPIDEVRTIEEVLAGVTGQPRFRAVLVTAFAGVALLLAAVGLYGLVSYSVAQRVPEIGIRLALGAKPAQVAGLVLGHAVKLSLVGIAVGLAGAVGVARLLQGLLFSVSATDPVVYAVLALALLGITLLACYVPARRAMQVDPMSALRAE